MKTYKLEISVFGRRMTFQCVRKSIAAAIECVETYYAPQAVFIHEII